MSRIQQVSANITAIGSITPWLFHDFYEPPFDLSLLISFGSGLAATLAIDYIVDDYLTDGERAVVVSQTTTTITVTDTGPYQPSAAGGGLGHGLAVGDAVTLRGSPAGLIDGVYAVASVTSATAYTLTTAVSQTLVGVVAYVKSGRVLTGAASTFLPVAPVTARTAVGIVNPIVASRLRCTAFTTAGVATLLAVQGGASS